MKFEKTHGDLELMLNVSPGDVGIYEVLNIMLDLLLDTRAVTNTEIAKLSVNGDAVGKWISVVNALMGIPIENAAQELSRRRREKLPVLRSDLERKIESIKAEEREIARIDEEAEELKRRLGELEHIRDKKLAAEAGVRQLREEIDSLQHEIDNMPKINPEELEERAEVLRKTLGSVKLNKETFDKLNISIAKAKTDLGNINFNLKSSEEELAKINEESERKVEALHDTKAAAAKKKHDTDEEIKRINDELHGVNQLIKAGISERDDKSQKLAELNERKEQLDYDNRRFDENIGKLSIALEDILKLNEQKEIELVGLKESIDVSNRKAAELNEHRDALAKQHGDIGGEIRRLEEDIHTLDEKIKVSAASRDDKAMKLGELHQRKDHAEAENHKLDENILRSKEELDNILKINEQKEIELLGFGERIDAAKHRIGELDEQKERLAKQHGDIEGEIRKIEEDIHNLDEWIKNDSLKRDDKTEKLGELHHKKEQLEHDIHKLDENIEISAKELENLSRVNEQKEIELLGFGESIEGAKHKLAELNNQKDQLGRKLTEIGAEIRRVEEDSQIAEEHIKAAAAERDDKARKLGELHHKNEQLEFDNRKLHENIGEAKREWENLSRANEQKEMELLGFKNNIEAERARTEKTQEELAAAERALAEIEAENNAMKERIPELNKIYQNTVKEKGAKAFQIKLLSSDIDRIHGEIADAELELSDKTTQKEIAEKKLADMKSEMQKSVQEKEQLENEYKVLANNLVQIKEQIAALNKSEAELTADINAKKKQLDYESENKSAKVQRLNNELSHLNDKIKELEMSIVRLGADKAKAEEEFNRLSAEVIELETQIRNMREKDEENKKRKILMSNTLSECERELGAYQEFFASENYKEKQMVIDRYKIIIELYRDGVKKLFEQDPPVERLMDLNFEFDRKKAVLREQLGQVEAIMNNLKSEYIQTMAQIERGVNR